METVEVVIRIPQKAYEQVIKQGDIRNGMNSVYIAQAIINGTVLPQGHGDLVDKNILKEKAWKHIDDTESYSAVYLEDVEDAPTVIEADKDGQDER